MTHFDAETLELVSDETLAARYDRYLDESGEFNICIDGNDLIPSEALKSADPIAYEDSLNTYINALYDAGELVSEWDREERFKELCEDWAFSELSSLVNHTTVEQDKIVKAELFKLYEQGVLTLENSEIELSVQYEMLDVMSALVARLNENKK